MNNQHNSKGYYCLLFAIQLFFSPFICFATSASDTTYFDYITINGVAYDVKLKETPQFFELSMRGPKLYFRLDSSIKGKTVTTKLILDSFSTALSESPVRQLPLDFNQQLYFSRTLSNVIAQIISKASSAHLAAVIQEDATIQQELKSSYQRIKENFLVSVWDARLRQEQQKNKEEVQTLNKGHKRTIDSLLNIIDQVDEENKYGGQMELVDKDSLGIAIYTTRRFRIDTDQVRFYPKKVMVRTFNNFIDLIHVDGEVVAKGGKRYYVRCYNPDYSIPLKHLYMRNQYVVFSIPEPLVDKSEYRGKNAKRDNTWRYMLNASDLIRLNAYQNHFTFMVKNDAYVLSKKDSIVPYFRRSFYDYLNFTTFLDFLGVEEKTPNSLIQLEGRVRLPMQLTNSKLGVKYSKDSKQKTIFRDSYNNVFFPKIDVYLNAAFVNGSQQDNRFGTIYNQASISTDMDSLFIDHFDLVRKYNIHTGLEVGLFKKEKKARNINTYIDYAVRLWRSTLRYTIVDSAALDQQEQFNAWSWTHGPILRFEYRPDQNIGADFSFAADFRQRILNSDNDNLKVFEVKGPIYRNIPQKPSIETLSNYQRTNYKLEFNVYYMVNPRRSNGGLYFRSCNYFTYNFKQIFPQLLVGYSTRLNGMINNLTDRTVRN